MLTTTPKTLDILRPGAGWWRIYQYMHRWTESSSVQVMSAILCRPQCVMSSAISHAAESCKQCLVIYLVDINSHLGLICFILRSKQAVHVSRGWAGLHEDIAAWKRFPHYWPSHTSRRWNALDKGQYFWSLMLSCKLQRDVGQTLEFVVLSNVWISRDVIPWKWCKYHIMVIFLSEWQTYEQNLPVVPLTNMVWLQSQHG